MKVSIVPQEAINDVWLTVEPMIQRALDRAPGRYAAVDVLISLLQGQQALWIAIDEKSKTIEAAFTTKIYDVPLGRVCSFEWIGGERMLEWVHEAIDIVEQYALDFKCTRIEGHGRTGWGEFLKDHGWRKFAVSFEKEIGNG